MDDVLAGTEVSAEVRKPIIAYLGDSAPGGLDRNPAMYEAKVLICELTFVAPGSRADAAAAKEFSSWPLHRYGTFELSVRRGSLHPAGTATFVDNDGGRFLMFNDPLPDGSQRVGRGVAARAGRIEDFEAHVDGGRPEVGAHDVGAEVVVAHDRREERDELGGLAVREGRERRVRDAGAYARHQAGDQAGSHGQGEQTAERHGMKRLPAPCFRGPG